MVTARQCMFPISQLLDNNDLMTVIILTALAGIIGRQHGCNPDGGFGYAAIRFRV